MDCWAQRGIAPSVGCADRVCRLWVVTLLVLAVTGSLAGPVAVGRAADDAQVHVAVDVNGDLTPAAQAYLTGMGPGQWDALSPGVRGSLQRALLGTLLPPAGAVVDWQSATRKVCVPSLGNCWFYTRDLQSLSTAIPVNYFPQWDGKWSCGSHNTDTDFCHASAREDVFVSSGNFMTQVSSSQSVCPVSFPDDRGFARVGGGQVDNVFCWPELISNVGHFKFVAAGDAGVSVTSGPDDPNIIGSSTGPYDPNWVRSAGEALIASPDARDTICFALNPYGCADPSGRTPPGIGGSLLRGGSGGPGTQAAPNVPRCEEGDPVNCATGNFFESITDVAVTGRGLDLDLTRTYNAQDAATVGQAGLFGWGWSASWLDRLVVDPLTSQVTVVGSDGSRVAFYPRGSSFDGAPWVQSTLSRLGDGSYRYTLPDESVWSFTASGRLQSKRDNNGNTTTVTYDASSRPSVITDPAGRTLALSYNAAGFVSRVDAPGSRSVSYGYDAGGHLTSVSDLRGFSTTFAYDAQHRMTSMTDPRGAQTQNTYDGSDRVLTQTDPLGRVLTFAYAGEATTITDPRGTVTEQLFTANAPTRITVAKGTAQETVKAIAYDAAMNPVRVTDERGEQWTYGYDAAGNRTSAKDPLLRQTTWTYDGARHVLSETKPSGLVTTNTYDAAGNLKTVSRAHSESGQAQTTTLAYDAQGQLTSMTDALGHAWTYAYDAAGNLTSRTSPLGNTTTYGYSTAGFMTSKVAPKGNLSGGNPAQYTTTFARDAAGNATTITDPRGKSTVNVYDAAGNLTSVTDRDGRQFQTTFDLLGRPTRVTRPDGTWTGAEYDENGNLLRQTDGLGRVTTYAYDKHDRPVTVSDPLSRVTSYGYDQAGNRTSLTDAAGRLTTFTFDAAGQLTGSSASSGSPANVSYAYSADGLRTSMSDETGTSTWTHDSLNRLVAAKNANDQTVSYTYDLGDRVTAIGYPAALVPGAPGSTPSTVPAGTVTRTFDDDDRMLSVKDWLNNTTSYTYDANSNISTIARPNGTTATNLYDVNDGLVKITDAGGSFSRVDTYTRTDDQLLKTQVETGTAAQPNPTYAYDSSARLTGTGATAKQTYAYDAADNPTKIVRNTLTANQSFDPAHQITQIKNASNATTASFGYSPLGERSSFTNTSTGFVTTYGYDQAGQLRAFTGKDTAGAALSQTYGYDGLGLRRWRQAANVRTHHTWDGSGGLPLMIQDGSTSYIYGPEGVPIEQILSGGTVRQLHHDQLGSIRAVTSSTRSVLAAYSYDPYGQPLTTTGTGAAANLFRYAGQYTDQTGLLYLRARYYDPATAQFLTRDPLEAQTLDPYGYAARSPVSNTDNSGLISADDLKKAILKLVVPESGSNEIGFSGFKIVGAHVSLVVDSQGRVFLSVKGGLGYGVSGSVVHHSTSQAPGQLEISGGGVATPVAGSAGRPIGSPWRPGDGSGPLDVAAGFGIGTSASIELGTQLPIGRIPTGRGGGSPTC
jgi:RHS repeat-associated protein